MSHVHDAAGAARVSRAQARRYRTARGPWVSWRILLLPSMAVGGALVALGIAVERAAGWEGETSLGAMVGVLLGLAFVVTVVVAAERWRAGARRPVDAALAAWAASAGLDTLVRSQFAQHAKVGPFADAPSLFAEEGWQGSVGEVGVEAYHLVYRGSGTDFVFDPRAFAVVSAWTRAAAPTVELQPRSAQWDDALDAGLTIDSEEFRRRWRVLSGDHSAARALLTPALVRRVMSSDAAGLTVAWDGNAVHVFSRGYEGDPARWQGRLALATDLAALTQDAPPVATTPSTAGTASTAGQAPTVRDRHDLVPQLAKAAVVVAAAAAGLTIYAFAQNVVGLALLVILLAVGLGIAEPVGRAVRRRRGR